MPDYHLALLNKAFEQRREKNPRYSLRAFASQLGVHPSALSRILQGKQTISKKNGVLIAKKLGLSKDDERLFLKSIAALAFERDCAELGEKVGQGGLERSPRQISDQDYATIASLACLALKELAHTEGFREDPAWLARRVGLSTREAEKCLETLVDTGYLAREGGRLVPRSPDLTAVSASATNKVRKALQREILARAGESLDKDPFEARGHYGMTVATDPARVQEANMRIFRFIEGLSDFLGSGNPTEVYQVGVQLFPLTTPAKEPGR